MLLTPASQSSLPLSTFSIILSTYPQSSWQSLYFTWRWKLTLLFLELLCSSWLFSDDNFIGARVSGLPCLTLDKASFIAFYWHLENTGFEGAGLTFWKPETTSCEFLAQSGYNHGTWVLCVCLFFHASVLLFIDWLPQSADLWQYLRWSARNWTQLGHMEGKHFVYCIVSLVPIYVFKNKTKPLCTEEEHPTWVLRWGEVTGMCRMIAKVWQTWGGILEHTQTWHE